jgi:apolipoprotein N-acyltransferase
MDWPRDRTGRILAGAYLAGFVATLIGIVWTLINQWTGGSGPQTVVGGVFFAAGLLALFAAFALRDRGAAESRESAWRKTERVWHRLALGRELRAAVQLLRG